MRRAIDVSHLPTHVFGHRNLMWWGGSGMMAIEGTMFVLLMVAYAYLKGRNPEWPPGFFAPVLFWGTLNTGIMFASVVPAYLTKTAAERMDLRRTRLWLCVSLLFSAAFLTVRIFEFGALNVWWDSNAYGSIVWTLLGFHTLQLVTDFFDSVAFAVLLFTGPLKKSHFVDVSENSLYWYFVVLFWIPVYGFIYLAPRFA